MSESIFARVILVALSHSSHVTSRHHCATCPPLSRVRPVRVRVPVSLSRKSMRCTAAEITLSTAAARLRSISSSRKILAEQRQHPLFLWVAIIVPHSDFLTSSPSLFAMLQFQRAITTAASTSPPRAAAASPRRPLGRSSSRPSNRHRSRRPRPSRRPRRPGRAPASRGPSRRRRRTGCAASPCPSRPSARSERRPPRGKRKVRHCGRELCTGGFLGGFRETCFSYQLRPFEDRT